MWIEPYHRGLVPEGTDHSHFGEEIACKQLTDPSADWPFSRRLVIDPPLPIPESAFFGPQGRVREVPLYLEAAEARIRRATTGPVPATLFFPDHAVLMGVTGEEAVVEESTWHSNIFFSKWLRVDRSTNWRWRAERLWAANQVVAEPTAHCYHRFHYQYFHWVVDTLPRVWAMRRERNISQETKWLVGPLDRPHQIPSLALFDIRPDQCVWYRDSIVVKFEHLFVPAFEFVEDKKLRPPDFNTGRWNAGWSADFVMELRDRAHSRISSKRGPERIYVGRRDAHHRRITNAQEIESMLFAMGFEVVIPGELSFNEQVAAFSNAREIVGIHGAGLTNIIWAPANARILEFAAEGKSDIGYRFLAAMLGHHHAVLEGKASPDERGVAYADMTLDRTAVHHALNWLTCH